MHMLKIVLEMRAIDLSKTYSPERFKNKALRMALSVGTSSHSMTSADPTFMALPSAVCGP
eukprot:15731096-Heterocapsa_arctica.AAC.1